MSDIFESELAGPPKSKNGITYVNRILKSGTITAELYFLVFGTHEHAPLDRSKPPFPMDRFQFPDFNVHQDVTTGPDTAGTIYYDLRIAYRVLDRGSFPAGPTMGLGLVNYRCSFDYSFSPPKDGSPDLIIQNPVQIQHEYQEHEMDDDLYVTLANFNPNVGLAGGPKFVSISPSVNLPGVSSSPMNVGFTGGKGVQGSFQASSNSVSVPQSGGSIGSFTIDIHVVGTDRDDGPPPDFVDDMAVTVRYGEKETTFTRERQAVVLAWVTKINRKYPRLAEAVRTGGPILFVDGFASMTGNAIDNQTYAQGRLTPIKQYIAQQLAVPADKINPKPYGSQQAAWHYDYDTKGGAVKGPRSEDRRVVTWFDKDAAWKVVKGSR